MYYFIFIFIFKLISFTLIFFTKSDLRSQFILAYHIPFLANSVILLLHTKKE